jgi:predicted metal-dependent HD superfamily phosphohydrolase
VVTQQLREAWGDLMPQDPELGEYLLTVWGSALRRYHGLEHLADCLSALTQLGSVARPEALAIWFHDAVHTNTASSDEHASAALASARLSEAGLPGAEVEETARLILVTITHQPEPGDDASARVSDADLAILGADPLRYAASVVALRAEYGDLDDRAWRRLRLQRVTALRQCDQIFHTPRGRELWAQRARANLDAEDRALQQNPVRP